MAIANIYTLDPTEGGGVPAKMRAIVALLQQLRHTPRLIYAATSRAPASGHWSESLRYLATTGPRWETNFDLPCFTLPYWPLPLWATALPWLGWARRPIAEARIHVIVSGSAHIGLPVALLNKLFIVWIGTLYEEELVGKAALGDRWARKILGSPERRLLAAEEKLIFGRAALILTNGNHTAQTVMKTYPSVAHRVRATIYPVDTDTFRPDPLEREQAIPTPFLLFTARINDPRKNIGMLFRAFAQVRTIFPTLRLILTGEAPAPALLQALNITGVSNAVEFLGFQNRSTLIRLYQQAQLFVLPSLQEGLGISMLEALACGTPVVATRCGGPESVILDGQTGRLVANDNAEAFAAAIIELLSDPTRLDRMREKCVQFARDNFSKKLIDQKLLDAFRTVYPDLFPD